MSFAYLMTAAGYILGHSHKGRSFGRQLYTVPTFGPVGPGPWAVVAHGIIGKSWLVIGWTQMLLGVVVLRGYCGKEELGQCLAHYIMGSAFIGYGVLLAVVLLAGGGRIWYGKRWRDGGKGEKVVSPRSQEWWDGWVIMLWVSTLGVIWWAGGALAVFLARNGKRTVVPALIIIVTGWAMSSHSQAMEISTKVHGIFGVVLMSAGAARIIEITFVLKDAASISDDESTRPSRNAKPVEIQLLVAGGILFMSATDEELKAVEGIEMDHVTYILLMLSIGFVIYLYANLLLHIYATSGRNSTGKKQSESTAGYTPLALHVNSTLAPSATTPTTAFTPAPAYPGRPMGMEGDDVYKITDDRDSFEEEVEMDEVRASEQGRLALRPWNIISLKCPNIVLTLTP
ncbi:YTP1 protein [Rhizoctonia solani AG-1 IA]|uniref:YTP1 protein n=1 Tax=Thanatephorus cucumeris (strain AG1-IA) TaxID=983506 RepID=L8XB62_THACA|nr:YTP1 protein [Rhizoctonia solani AG-1 IA]